MNQHESSSIFSPKALKISKIGLNMIAMKSEKLLTNFGQIDETHVFKANLSDCQKTTVWEK